jgi:SHS2 domain-containing protein
VSFEHFDHGADIGVRGVGPTMASAFAEAARALTAVVCDPGLVRSRTTVDVRRENPDPELLLVDWLNAVVFEMATRRMLFSRFDVREIVNGRLEATLHGEGVDRARHQPAVEVKGATLTALSVRTDEHGDWIAESVVDV